MPTGGLPGAVGRVFWGKGISCHRHQKARRDGPRIRRPAISAFPGAGTLPRRAGRWFHHARGKQRIRTRRQSETGSDSVGLVPVVGLEPTRGISPTDFESVTSANSITPARIAYYTILARGRQDPGGIFAHRGGIFARRFPRLHRVISPSPSASEGHGTARRPGTPAGRWEPAPSTPSPRTGQRARRRGSAPGAGRTGTG